MELDFFLWFFLSHQNASQIWRAPLLCPFPDNSEVVLVLLSKYLLKSRTIPTEEFADCDDWMSASWTRDNLKLYFSYHYFLHNYYYIIMESGLSPKFCNYSYLIGLRAISNPWITALLAEAAMNIAPSGCTLRNDGMKVVPFDDEIPHLVWHSNLCWLISINRSVPGRKIKQKSYVGMRDIVIWWLDFHRLSNSYLPSVVPRTTRWSVINAWHVIRDGGIGECVWLSPTRNNGSIASNIILYPLTPALFLQ